jgi:hypothetical protein
MGEPALGTREITLQAANINMPGPLGGLRSGSQQSSGACARVSSRPISGQTRLPEEPGGRGWGRAGSAKEKACQCVPIDGNETDGKRHAPHLRARYEMEGSANI